jgi:2-keto-4-pentenoate hydratase
MSAFPVLQDSRVARGMTAQFALWRKRIAAGEQALGWKVGFGAPAVMQKLGIVAPLVGFLTSAARVEPGATISLKGWKKPAAEAEIAVYMGTDLKAGASRGEAIQTIAGIGPAIELADVEFAPDDVEAILSHNIYQRHVLLGACDHTRAGCMLDGLTATILRNRKEFANTTDTQAATGELVDIVRHVAEVLHACGESLRAGQVIITGSITPPLWVEPGEELAFDLTPVGDVAVRFAAS